MKITAESTVVNDGKLNTNINNAQTTANTATAKANQAQSTANSAQTTANQAKQVADNTAQYFWFTSSGSDTGAHISQKTQSEFIASPSGGNLLARSNGIAVRDGLEELAVFGASEARIGKSDDSLRVLTNAIQIYLNGVLSSSITTEASSGGGRNTTMKNETAGDTSLDLGTGGAGLSTGQNTTADPKIRARIGYGTIAYLSVNGHTWVEIDKNGNVSAPYINPKVLWSGASYLGDNQRADVSGDNFVSQPTGIVLVWSPYANGSALDYYWHYTYIPKSHIRNHEGQTVCTGLLIGGATLAYVGSKCVRVYNTYIEGLADNTATGTANGITYANNRWVLRYILGV